MGLGKALDRGQNDVFGALDGVHGAFLGVFGSGLTM
jgi:hypothetical protein